MGRMDTVFAYTKQELGCVGQREIIGQECPISFGSVCVAFDWHIAARYFFGTLNPHASGVTFLVCVRFGKVPFLLVS